MFTHASVIIRPCVSKWLLWMTQISHSGILLESQEKREGREGGKEGVGKGKGTEGNGGEGRGGEVI